MTSANAAQALKWCNTCSTHKPPSDFRRCSKNHDGLQSNCRDCANRARRRSRRGGVMNEVRLTTAEKIDVTERSIETAFSWRARIAVHKMAFDPDGLTEWELRLASRVVALLLLEQ